MGRVVMLVHGGAGTIPIAGLSDRQREDYHSGLREALSGGFAVLNSGGSAVDAVTEAVKSLEDNVLFNAGRGSVFTSAEALEMEASLMDGRDHRTGSITSLWGPRHPILGARAVMEQTPHVFLTGQGAVDFCSRLEHCEKSWFVSERRLAALRTSQCGTVGAVALDSAGNLSAATSTGGRTGKMPGRIGDTPIIGAGTWAANDTCAVSCTGFGEAFIRTQAAHEVDVRMRWGKQSLKVACEGVVFTELPALSGDGGLIAVDAAGNFELLFNSEGMYRGVITSEDLILRTAVHREDYATSALSFPAQ